MLTLRAAPGSAARRANHAVAALALMFLGFSLSRTGVAPGRYPWEGAAILVGVRGITELFRATRQRRAEAEA